MHLGCNDSFHFQVDISEMTLMNCRQTFKHGLCLQFVILILYSPTINVVL